MYVCTGGYGWEEEGRQAKSEGVTHGIYEDIRYKEAEGIVGKDEGAERLAQ